MCTFLQKLLKIDVFHHFWTLSDDFFIVSIKKLRKNVFEESNSNCLPFSAFKRKSPTFPANSFGVGYHNCLQPIRMKILRTFFPENSFPFYHFWNLTGSLSDYVGKKLTWANFFSFLAKVFQLAWQNWKPFVHLSSLKLLKNSENHRGTTWETFRNLEHFETLSITEREIFCLSTKSSRWEIHSLLSRRRRK